MDAFDLNAPLIFSVAALNNYLRELLETDEVLQDLWVRGEISNFSQPRFRAPVLHAQRQRSANPLRDVEEFRPAPAFFTR
jgi:hypothetical protein